MAIFHQAENIIMEQFIFIRMYGNYVVITFELNFSLSV